jgi:hypothetical protein
MRVWYYIKRNHMLGASVSHLCNTSYSGGRD